MFPLLSLFGLAFVAGLWPDSGSDDTKDNASGVQTASSVDTDEDENPDNPLTHAASEPIQAAETLGTANDTDGSPTGQSLTGTEGADFLYGEGWNDTLIGGDGNDTLYGLDDDDDGDALIGGDDHDHLWLGGGDTGTGGSGDDQFHLTDDTDAAAIITDFNPDDDIVTVYYDATGPEPVLRVDETDEGMCLWADEHLLAVFPDTAELPLDNIHLVPDQLAA